jgi:hypothetical protein
MWIARLLRGIGHGLAALLIEGGRCIVWLAIVCTAAPALFVLSAQVWRWSATGEWRALSLSELLQIFELPAAPLTGAGSAVLSLPGPLVLLLGAAALIIVDRLLARLEKSRRNLVHRSRQRSVVQDIEHALARSRGEKARDLHAGV